jgi:hypothetical protein
VGTGGECEEGVGDEVAECRGGLIIAAWAVGGEVSFITFSVDHKIVCCNYYNLYLYYTLYLYCILP